MLCEMCKKNEATVLIRHSVNGNTVEMRLCPHCAEELQASGKLSLHVPGFFSFPSFFDDDDFFSPEAFFPFFSESPKRIAAEKVKTCPLCGSRFSEIAEKGKVGCAECYHTFAEELERTIHSLHGRVSHIGKKPKGKGSAPAKEPVDSLTDLKNKLKKAVEEEKYEDAAKLRDEIRRLSENAGEEGRGN